MEMNAQHANVPHYFVPAPSRLPVYAGASFLVIMIGAASWVNEVAVGPFLVAAGLLSLLVILYKWFGDAIGESESGMYGKNVDLSFRWSMSWFIFSEVMFFAGFFGALFYARSISMPWLADLDHKFIWPHFAAHWGNIGPAGTIEAFRTMGPFPIPTINTALLLSSGVTI